MFFNRVLFEPLAFWRAEGAPKLVAAQILDFLRSGLVISRPGPHCVVCKKDFRDSSLFTEHLQSQEHKMVDSPLEFILQRVLEPPNPGRPKEYEDLRRQAAVSGSGEQEGELGGINLSALAIGIDSISSVKVPFCRVCNTFVPEDGQPDVLKRHRLTPQHISIINSNSSV